MSCMITHPSSVLTCSYCTCNTVLTKSKYLFFHYFSIFILMHSKGKAIPLQAWTGPEGSKRLRLPDFKTIGPWKCQGCQPYAPTAFTSRKHSSMTPSEIEPTTFRLVAQCLNRDTVCPFNAQYQLQNLLVE
jgi:hypothetical protein